MKFTRYLEPGTPRLIFMVILLSFVGCNQLLRVVTNRAGALVADPYANWRVGSGDNALYTLNRFRIAMGSKITAGCEYLPNSAVGGCRTSTSFVQMVLGLQP